jgi:hypothetical protein
MTKGQSFFAKFKLQDTKIVTCVFINHSKYAYFANFNIKNLLTYGHIFNPFANCFVDIFTSDVMITS